MAVFSLSSPLSCLEPLWLLKEVQLAEEIKYFLLFCCSLLYDSLFVLSVCNVQCSWSIGTKFLGFVMDELMLIEARSSPSDDDLDVRTGAQMSLLPPCIWRDRVVIL